jgi:hypothetical protein
MLRPDRIGGNFWDYSPCIGGAQELGMKIEEPAWFKGD